MRGIDELCLQNCIFHAKKDKDYPVKWQSWLNSLATSGEQIVKLILLQDSFHLKIFSLLIQYALFTVYFKATNKVLKRLRLTSTYQLYQMPQGYFLRNQFWKEKNSKNALNNVTYFLFMKTQ